MWVKPRVPLRPLAMQVSIALLGWLALATVSAAAGWEDPAQLAPPQAPAQNYTVTKTADTNDGACNSDCSLREAVIAANANEGLDTIRLPAGVYTLTLAGAHEDAAATGDLDIRAALHLIGAGASSTIIAGNGADRLLHIDNFPVPGQMRGAILDGEPPVTIRGVTLRNGRAEIGGAIYSKGDLTLEQVLIDNNRADQNGGGVACVEALANMTVIDSVISHNQATSEQLFQGQGGGLYLSRCGTLTLARTTLLANGALNGGGIYLNEAGFAISQSSVISNSTRQNGAGLFVGAAAGGAIRNSTLSGNQANGSGGGIYMSGDGSATLVNLTIAHNRADQDQTGDGDGGGLVSRGFFRLAQSILAGNVDTGGEHPECFLFTADAGASQGYNLLQNNTGCALATESSDLVNLAAQLNPLHANGDPTLTHLPAASSPVIDAVPNANCALTDDQRGHLRPLDGNGDGTPQCDIGAVEVEPTAGGADCNFIANDEASLRQAIACVNGGGAGSFTITITADISYTQVALPITNTLAEQVVIQGNGHTLNANQQGRGLTANTLQHLLIQNLTLTGGQGDQPAVPIISGWGGGILIYCGELGHCTTALTNVTLHDNQADEGGGLAVYCYVDTRCVTTVQDSVIHHNQAVEGGGASTGFDEENFAFTLALTNTLVHHNLAETGGGLRSRGGTLTLVNSSVYENQAAQGGGIGIRTAYLLDAHFRNSSIHTNRASVSGGGLYIFSPDNGGGVAMSIANSTLSNNLAHAATGVGGGLYAASEFGNLQLRLINSTIAMNLAAVGSGAFFLNQSSGFTVTHIATLTNTIIADNYQTDCASAGFGPGDQPLRSGGHNLDDDGSCLVAAIAQPTDIVSGAARLSIVTDNGGPTWTQGLLPGSDAIDAGNDQVCATAPINGQDQRGISRPQGAHCDIGAFEATTVNTTTRQLFVSSTSSGQVGAVHFRDEDILHYDPTNNIWALLFDGSDVGISDDVDAFAFQDDGGLLLSLSNPVTLTGLGLVDDSDIVKFVATSLGVTTTGTFAWYLDGSDVGLETEAEDIDAIDFAPDGRLLVSISNNGLTAPGIDDGHDEDLFVLNNGVFGAESEGLWTLYLDGSAVALSTGRDLNGLWVDPANGELYLSTNGPYTVTGLSGDQDDLLVCTPSSLGTTSACAFRLFWDGDLAGFGGERLDGIDIGAAPALFNPDTSALVAADVTNTEPAEEAADDDEEGLQPLYLPVIERARE